MPDMFSFASLLKRLEARRNESALPGCGISNYSDLPISSLENAHRQPDLHGPDRPLYPGTWLTR